jgi:hypothetical protein
LAFSADVSSVQAGDKILLTTLLMVAAVFSALPSTMRRVPVPLQNSLQGL